FSPRRNRLDDGGDGAWRFPLENPHRSPRVPPRASQRRMAPRHPSRGSRRGSRTLIRKRRRNIRVYTHVDNPVGNQPRTQGLPRGHLPRHERRRHLLQTRVSPPQTRPKTPRPLLKSSYHFFPNDRRFVYPRHSTIQKVPRRKAENL